MKIAYTITAALAFLVSSNVSAQQHAKEQWHVGKIAADNGATIAIDLASITENGPNKNLTIAFLDGLVFLDDRASMRANVNYNCTTGQGEILDYSIQHRRGNDFFGGDQELMTKFWGSERMVPQTLSDEVKRTIQRVACDTAVNERSQRYTYQHLDQAVRDVFNIGYWSTGKNSLLHFATIRAANQDLINSIAKANFGGRCGDAGESLNDAFQRLDKNQIRMSNVLALNTAEEVRPYSYHSFGNSFHDYGMASLKKIVAIGREHCGIDVGNLSAQGVIIPDSMLPGQVKP